MQAAAPRHSDFDLRRESVGLLYVHTEDVWHNRKPIATQIRGTLPTVQAQESGEQFQLQDDIQYALDGLCFSTLPCDRAGNTTRRACI